MKNIIKTGNVRAWIIGNGNAYMVLADETATEEDIERAIADEEIVQEYRVMGRWN